MSYHGVVLAKQVPDTKRITGEAMKDDGTVNRAALPAIFNPEDLHALEAALAVRDAYGGTVTVMSMGPPRAADILREALCRGADRAILLTDRRSAGSDTLATSYILSCAVRHLDRVDLVFCGRQAIDGDTAQVGPQLAEKIGLPQVTYVEQTPAIENGTLRVRRNTGHGWERVETGLPVLLTVTDGANTPRPPAARRLMKYRRARCRFEIEQELTKALLDAPKARIAAKADAVEADLKARGLLIEQWGLDDFEIDLGWVGLNGSPTKVNRIQSVVLKASGTQRIEPTEQGIHDLVHTLIQDHTFG